MSLKTVRGTEDLSGTVQRKHNHIIQVFKTVASRFCFQEISTPVFEMTEVFSRTLGVDSDIVNKEMFTFKDRSENSLTLRPEGTAGVARHFITEKLQQQLPLRFMYQGPMFRYERPQKGRQRQFHTAGVELLGEESPNGDVECLSLAWLFLKELGLTKNIYMEVNSIGDAKSRNNYKEALVKYLTPLKEKLSEDSRRRLITNPLRILDSKEKQDQKIIKEAPVLSDFLNKESNLFFENILKGLDAFQIPWKKNEHLVRGLDYYNHCVYEFKSDHSQLGSQNTLLAGGRYDSLINTLSEGSVSASGTGWGAGLERLSLLIEDSIVPSVNPYCALVPLGEEAENQALKLAWQLRQEGISVFYPKATGNLSKKMKRASQAQAHFAIIFGPDEIKKQEFTLKNMKDETQKTVSAEELVKSLKNYI